MSELTYNFNGRGIRATVQDGEPRFVAKDVAEALGYVWNGTARIAHIPEEWRGVTSVVTPSGTQEMAVLSEQGLYFFLGRSDKPAALPFQKWIAGEVIPSIRRTGSYTASGAKRGKAKAVTGAYLRELNAAYDKSIIGRDDWRRMAGLDDATEGADKQICLPLNEDLKEGLEFYQRIAESGGLVNSDRDDLFNTYRRTK
jgi:prophage antirepressor-like protein